MAKNNPAKPSPGWWAVEHNIGSDRRLATLPEEMVLPCLGLLLAAIGRSISVESPIITEAELTRHSVVPAANTESILAAAHCLVDAGIWTYVPGEGFDCGASEHIAAKVDRIDRARKAVEARLAKKAQAASEASAEGYAWEDGE